ncbi:DUF819 domain-containing protein [Finegoldia magna]|uniref:DUF819 family protein n=1 Tax=Finegoldia magna TaxID=1260 RepID=UPI0027B8B40B|nr:DUF819 family protein [Finegoldia magna]MDU4571610.1 DUF819 family protein [Finegoldia magna]MDU5977424.1 DUF819 family protein [Finegoldia magna]
MGSFISAESTWILWAVLASCAALAIFLEQKYTWASKVTGCILALTFTLILSNLKIIPTEAPVYDAVWSYVVPLAVPMLLFNADIKKIGRDSGRVLIIYLFSGIGTILGGFVAYFALKNAIPALNDIVPMFVGTYTGGSVNFVAMSQQYKVPGATVSAALVADNLLMALYFFTLMALPTMAVIKKHYKMPLVNALEEQSESDKEANKTMAAKYWGAKEISLKDIAFTVALSFVIVAISDKLATVFGDLFKGEGAVSAIFGGLLGNKYLLMTTFTMILASVFPKQISSIRGSQEIGTFLIYLFFAVIGAPASIGLILRESPLLLVFALIVVLINLIVSLIFGKLFKFNIEEIIIASNANVGGPTTAAAMAVSKGWTELIVPALLVGTLGYVIGNYYGILSGILLH